MSDEIIYMLGVVGVGFLVNYTLRALPFLLFAGRRGELPAWVSRFGNLISPIIIAALIVYSYSGLAWRTPWPYLAGVFAVGLQLWRRNPLVSIVAGTVLYMVLLTCCGCVTQRTPYGLDPLHPEIRLTAQGVAMGETVVPPKEIVKNLEEAGVSKDQAIHVRMEMDMSNLKPFRALKMILVHGGYTRVVLVTNEHDETQTKSGETYAGNERMSRRNDIDFYVLNGKVLFGVLTQVGPDGVLACLKENHVEKNQLIRLNYHGNDKRRSKAGNVAVEDNLKRMEAILRDAGYRNVRRHDMDLGGR